MGLSTISTESNMIKLEERLHLEDDDVLGVVEGAGQVDLRTVHVRHQVVTPRNTRY